MPDHRVAVIDIGSNSGRVTVLRVGPQDHLEVTADSRAPLRLARDIQRDAEFSDVTIDRTARVAADFVAIGRSAGADRIVAVATAAVRDSRNADALLERIRARGGRGCPGHHRRGRGAVRLPRCRARPGRDVGGRLRHRRRQRGGDALRGSATGRRVEPSPRSAAAERPVPAARPADRRRDQGAPRATRTGRSTTSAWYRWAGRKRSSAPAEPSGTWRGSIATCTPIRCPGSMDTS